MFIYLLLLGLNEARQAVYHYASLKPDDEGLVKKKQPYTCIPGYVKIRYVFLILLVLYVSIMS